MELHSRWVRFRAYGHPNIRASHRTTMELTRERDLTPRGDCIVGVGSQLSPRDLPGWFKEQSRSGDSIIIAVLCAEGLCDSVVGRGSRDLTFLDPARMVFRKSKYVSDNTVMVSASKSAADLDRRVVELLARGAELEVWLTVLPAKHAWEHGGVP